MTGPGWGFVQARRKAKPLTHEQIRELIRQQNEEARQENWSPRTRALGFALGLGRMFNVLGEGNVLTPEVTSPGPQTPPASLARLKEVAGQYGDVASSAVEAAKRFARGVARRDPGALGSLAGIVAPVGAATLAPKAAALSEAGRVGTAGKPFLPESFEPFNPEGDVATLTRRGGRITETGATVGAIPPETSLPKQYAILTAENPGGAPASPAENLRNMEMLKVRLRIMGKEGVPTKGAYIDNGQLLTENGLLVPGMTRAEAAKIGKAFGQNSIITHEGMTDLTTGTTTPISKIEHGVAAEAPYTELPGGRRFRMSFRQPPKPLADVVSSYRQQAGIAHDPLPPVRAVDPEAGATMAKTYEGLKSEPNNPEVRAAYGQLMTEIRSQAQALKDAGYTWEYVDKDPYKTSAEMLKDLRENQHIKVLKTSEAQGHPLLSADENNLFRAVHDIWGHGVEGNPFGPKGEENAFRQHAASLSPLAQRALATETRGQNSWFNFGPHGTKPVTERPFAQQKAALWPTEQLGEYPAKPGPYEQTPFRAAIEMPDGKVISAHTHLEATQKAEAAGYSDLTDARDGFVRVTEPDKLLSRHETEQLMGLPRTSGGMGSEDLIGGTERLKDFIGTGPESITPEDLAKTQVIGAPTTAPKAPARSLLVAPSIQLPFEAWNDILGYTGRFNPAEGVPGIAALSKVLPPLEPGSILPRAAAGSVIGPVPQEASWAAPEPARLKRLAEIREQIGRALEHPLVREDLERGVGMGFHDWYNTDAILQSAIDQLGPEQGRTAFNQLMGYMGPTSISASPEPNLRLAGYQFYRSLNPGAPQWAPGFRPLYPGLVNEKLAELAQLGALNPMAGPKLSRFTEALKGNWAGLAGDRHFWRALKDYGYTARGTSAGVSYGPAESALGDVMQGLADEGVLPVPENRSPVAAGQAAIWGGAGERTGVRNIETAPPTFSDIFERAIQRTGHYTGMSTADILRQFWTGQMPLF